MPEARYDGAAAWYDRLAGEFTRPFARALAAAGLRIELFEELDTRARSWTADSEDRTLVPWNILLVAAKPGARGAAA